MRDQERLNTGSTDVSMYFHLLHSKHACPPSHPQNLRGPTATPKRGCHRSWRLTVPLRMDADAGRKGASLEIRDNGCCFINKGAPIERFLTQHIKIACRHSREWLVKGWRDQKPKDTKLVLETRRWEKPRWGGAVCFHAGSFCLARLRATWCPSQVAGRVGSPLSSAALCVPHLPVWGTMLLIYSNSQERQNVKAEHTQSRAHRAETHPWYTCLGSPGEGATPALGFTEFQAGGCLRRELEGTSDPSLLKVGSLHQQPQRQLGT